MNVETQAKPSVNGSVKIMRRGRVKFQIGEGEPEITLDVIEIYDQWFEIDWALRDAEGVLPVAKANEHGQNRLNFVQALVNDAYARQHKDAPVPTLCRAEAEQFIMEVKRQAEELRNFFAPKKEPPSSVPENSEERVNFSQ